MFKLAKTNIAIDLGTSNVTVYVAGKGIVYKQANAVAVDVTDESVIALGDEAAAMLEKTPETVKLLMPMRSGVVSQFDVMSLILEHIINKVCKNNILRPNIIISTPVGITEPEKRTVISLACSSCAARVSTINSPIASALGSGISIEAPHGVMVVDIGAGTADIAVLTMESVSNCCSLKLGGDDMNEAIKQYIKRNRGYDIGFQTAEKIKRTLGFAVLPSEEIEMTVAGKEHTTGIPLLFTLTSTEVFEALGDIVSEIARGISQVLEETQPELYSDICNGGIVLAGGGSKLKGLDEALSERLKISVRLLADSENCAVKGAGYALKNLKKFEDEGLVFRLREPIDENI